MKKVMGTEVALVGKKMDKAVETIMGAENMSKSGKMKELFNLGLEVKDIATMMGVRYNFVYNVVSNMVIVDGVQVESNRKESKKDKVWELLDQGKTVKEVAVELKTNYNYIYKLKKEWEAKAVAEAQAADQVVEGGTK